MFYGLSRVRTRKDLCTLDKMLSLLPAPKHNFTPLSTVEKKTCKRGISAIFFGTRTIFIRAVPNFFCRVNGALKAFHRERADARFAYYFISFIFTATLRRFTVTLF